MPPTKNFWQELPRPFFALAPLADVTDAAFRRVVAARGKPHVMFTEFVSADGLMSPGRPRLLHDLLYTEAERPIVAQLFSGNPSAMEGAAALARELGFDGVDINMGCPDRSVEKQCAGAGLIKDPKRAQEVIRAAKRGAGGLPVSVKTRLGYSANDIETWLPALLDTEPAVITLHARTRREMSKVPARWDAVARAVEIRNDFFRDRLSPVSGRTLIAGNGDVRDIADARSKARETGCDGVMLGRAIFGNPWLFSGRTPTPNERLDALADLTRLFDDLLGDIKSFAVLKKHFSSFVTGFDGAKELRLRLMEAASADEANNILAGFTAPDSSLSAEEE